jgi:DNA-binding FadR family transcriptional regulator
MVALRPIATRPIQEEIQERIKEYIIGNKLQPGDPLPTETQIVEQLRVSRNVVREGLRALESLGVIYSRRGEGRYVSSFNFGPILQNLSYSMLFEIRDVREILDVRQKLEEGFIAEAIAAMTEKQMAELHLLVATMRERTQKGEPFLEQDLAFHRVISLAAGNSLLVRLLEVFWDVYRNLRDQHLYMPQNLEAEYHNHAAILQAIQAGQAGEARRLMSDHFAGIKERLRTPIMGHPQPESQAATDPTPAHGQ